MISNFNRTFLCYIIYEKKSYAEFTFKIIKNLDIYKDTTFTVEPPMSSLFTVNSNGIFKVITDSLKPDNPLCAEGKFFLVLIKATDLEGNEFKVKVVVQLSKIATHHRCPQILDTAMCQFSINQSDFDSSKFFEELKINLLKHLFCCSILFR